MTVKGRFFRVEISYSEDHKHQSSRYAKDTGRGWDHYENTISTYTRREEIKEVFVSLEEIKKANEQRNKYNDTCFTAQRYFFQKLPSFPQMVKMKLVPGNMMDEILGKSEFHTLIGMSNSGCSFKDTSDKGIYYAKLHFGIGGLYISEVSMSSEVEVFEHRRYEKYGYEHAYLREKDGEVSLETHEFIQKIFMCESFEKQFSGSWDMRYMPTTNNLTSFNKIEEELEEDICEIESEVEEESGREITPEDLKKLQEKFSR